MADFFMVSTRSKSNGVTEIYPKFIVKKVSDLMIRGGDFYAVWIEERKLWSTDENDAIKMIDDALDEYAENNRSKIGGAIKVLHMWDSETGMIGLWHTYCQKHLRDSFVMLDEHLTFMNDITNKQDYVSKKLLYPLEQSDISGYDKLISTLYTDAERHKIEWAIGSIINGDSVKIQKFMVLYGSAGTGKSTILNIIQMLFNGYYSVFDAKALGSASNSFALEAFKSNPLVAIQHDGDLSRIEDNTRLNSLVSHELMTVNEKFKATYSNSFKAFLFMGTNRPVKITDAKSGLIRRLIDVTPSGNKLSAKEYNSIMQKIPFELGGIAYHCKCVYENDKHAYDNYIPINMMDASNDFYNFVMDSFLVFKKENGISLKNAWDMYKIYCEDAKITYPFTQRNFKEELKNYFNEYYDRYTDENGNRIRSYYLKFKSDIFDNSIHDEPPIVDDIYTIDFKNQESIFDKIAKDYQAQYANDNGIPFKQWDSVNSRLSMLNTNKLHFVKVPNNHIVIDFDICDSSGEKSFEKNLEEASKWPKTYAELSKSGKGIHLHYIYNGDVEKLSRIYDDKIEIKVFTGKSSLRRLLTKCNDLPIATISSGLPLKGEKNKMVNFDTLKSEKALRTIIKRNLNKEYHSATKPSIDFIFKTLDDAYTNGVEYDVTDMRGAILSFAANSTNQSNYCISIVNKMKFKSDHIVENTDIDVEQPIVFFDVEVFKNLFLVNWKFQGEDKPVVRMINPTANDIRELVKFRLIGFNVRKYDNHILYARMLGYDNYELYKLSKKIVDGNGRKDEDKNCFFREAYNLSYTDIYDFASAGNKMSLKKWEIELGIHHKELGLDWDEPVPEEMWPLVAEYCDNDVIASEKVFNHLSGDWSARKILAELAGMTPNDTTNTLTTKFIFGSNRQPQNDFMYRDLSKPIYKEDLPEDVVKFLEEHFPKMVAKPHGPDNSYLPYFPGYKFDHGKSTYKGYDISEGGQVYSEPGMHGFVALLDIMSMHPHSGLAECIFGATYTKILWDLVYARVYIKHSDWDSLSKMFNGKLIPYIKKIQNGEMSSKDLSNALKTAINSIYGLTSASFINPFKDPRNIDNIIAKRGALFMIDLKEAVEARGFTVAHIKTDSIKIPDATEEIINFVMEFGELYGYTFEHEATYDKLCLVNKAVYIAKDIDGHWSATGAQFAHPYVFKKLFSKEPIEFKDLCETKAVQTALYLDFNEGLSDVSEYEKELKKLKRDSDNIDRIDELEKIISTGHDYKFVGRVGSFCPILPGHGAGILYRKSSNKYDSVSGTIGYRWVEAEVAENSNIKEYIDYSYFNDLATNAINDISKHCDFEWFVSDLKYESPPWVG